MSPEFLAKVAEHMTENKDQTNKRANRIVENKKIIIDAVHNLEKKVSVRIASLPQDIFKVNTYNLVDDYEKTTVLHSHIIDDIHELTVVVEEFKVLLNSLVGILHEEVKMNSHLRLKSVKEIEAAISKDQSFNVLNLKIKQLQAQIEKSETFSGMLKQKIGFIRDLTKMKTQEMYGRKGEE